MYDADVVSSRIAPGRVVTSRGLLVVALVVLLWVGMIVGEVMAVVVAGR